MFVNFLTESLVTLDHPQPDSVQKSFLVNADNIESDKHLIALTLWLEDRCIRQWYVE